MDLAELSWINLSVPVVGDFRLPIFSGEFSDWAAKGRWSDGQSFMLSMLTTLARTLPADGQLDQQALSALAPEDVDAIAEQIIDKTGLYFSLRHIVSGSGLRRTVRRRRDDEPFLLEIIEGERSSDRLLRVVKLWLGDQEHANELLQSRLSPASDLLKLRQEDLGVGHLVREQTGLDQITKIAMGRSVGLETSALAMSRLIPDYPSAIRESMKIYGAHPGLIAAALGSPARSAVAEAFEALATAREADPFRTLRAYPYIVGHTRSVVEQAIRGLSVADRYGGLAHAIADGRTATLWDQSRLADQFGFAEVTNRQFGLGITSSAIAAARAIGETQSVAELARSAFPPGYQLAAALGLQSTFARGLAADILRSYGESSDRSSTFGLAMGSATLADAEEFSDGEGAEYLTDAAARLIKLAENERDPIQLGAINAVLMFILALVGAAASLGGLYYAREQVTLARGEAAPSASDRELAKVIREVSENQLALAQAQREQVTRDRNIRYVHDRSVLRVDPNGDAPTIRLVYPDQLLRVVDERGDWLMVDVYDYQSDIPVRGWISRRRVKLRPAE